MTPPPANMAFKLYGIPPSPPCATAMLAAYEKGVEFELVLLDLGKGEHKAPDYLLKQVHVYSRQQMLQGSFCV